MQKSFQKMSVLSTNAINNVKIYNLASGKTLPQWANDKQRKSLKKDEGNGLVNIFFN